MNAAMSLSCAATIVRATCAPRERKWPSNASMRRRPIPFSRADGSTPKNSTQPVGSSSPNSPPRTSPSMKPTTRPSSSATCDESGSPRRRLGCFSFIGLLELGDVDLAHLQHRLHHPGGLRGIAVAEHLTQDTGDD